MVQKYLFILPAAFLFGAFLDGLPYGYFRLLRFIVSIAGIMFAVQACQAKSNWGIWVFGGIAVLFNPIAPLYFPRDIWLVIDAIVGCIFIVYGVRNKEGLT